MSDAARVELSILGHRLAVRTEASPDYIRTLASFLEDRVATMKRGGIRDAQASLILAALDIADELFRAREDVARRDGEVSARLGALVTLLEEATTTSSS